ncbi:MAG: hypothetical protein AAF799_45365 [Myxococcota bacterium]
MSDVQSKAEALVQALIRSFDEQVHRALEVRLDGSPTSMAFVDHYLSLARDEDREPIVSLVAAGAGAYFGELVRHQLGGTWVGDGKDPRRLRLLLDSQFIYFSPVDQAYEAIAGDTLAPDDPRIAPGPTFDTAFGLHPTPDDDDDDTETNQEIDDARWLRERLAEIPPIPADHFHSLTCRLETLQLMLELLAAKHAGEGRSPRHFGLADYVEVLAAG